MDPRDPRRPKWEQNIRKLKELRDLTNQMSERYRAAREQYAQTGTLTETRSFVAAYKSGRTLILELAAETDREQALHDAAVLALDNRGWAVAFQLGDEAVVIHSEAPGVH